MGAKLFSSRVAADGPTFEASSGALPSRSRAQSRLSEAAALLLFTGAAFLLLSLATARVDPLDASVHGANWVGPAGGNVAALLIQGFGLVAWLLPLEIALCSAPLFRGQRPRALGLRVAGDLIVAIVMSALVQVALPDAVCFGSAPAAGNVGLLFGELMRGAFSTLGSFLVGLTIVGLILIGRASFSFIVACQRTLSLARTLVVRVEAWFHRLTLAWSEARKLRGEHAHAARVAAQPRIETSADEAQILLALEDDGDWIPMDQTGTPPIAISEALRQGYSSPSLSGREPAKFSLDLGDDEFFSPVPVLVSSPALSPLLPVATEVAVSPPSEPRIIDTKPASQVEPVVVVKRTPRRGSFQLPSYDILQSAVVSTTELDRETILEPATRLEKTLAD